MFSKILIANRGEIACRVIQTARGLGIQSVAIYSDADRDSKHVEMADEAYRVGPASVKESYLLSDKILEIAKQTGAQAIHPGYGFMSENPDFVDACNKAGVTFIGPSAEAIRAMGLKDAAKKIMADAGVPIVPGFHGENQDPDYLAEQAAEIGFPVLIKATAGGGGKGMRRVNNPDEFADALAGAKREAAASFGEDRVLIEKYLDQSRHIEIQVFGDNYGDAVFLFERDCSLQRRHQKVVEEAPAPGMSEEMREAMGHAAVCAAKAIGYSGAGTVEFIVDHSEGLRADRFYFMEMNTRLQVEHPVTEMITSQDLVEWQLRIAAGAPLPVKQADLKINGHAIEVRIYAEDVGKGFLPATGTLSHFIMPTEGNNVRIDSGVRTGDTITPYYDPMIAKLIVLGNDRTAALKRMSAALRECQVAGCITNIEFLSTLINHPDFQSGNVDTTLIDRDISALTSPNPTCDEVKIIAALFTLGLMDESDDPDPFVSLRGWRHWSGGKQFTHLDIDGEIIEFMVDHVHDGFEIEYEGEVQSARILKRDHSKVTIELGERLITASVITTDEGVAVFYNGNSFVFGTPDRLRDEVAEEVVDSQVKASLPGKITVVNVSNGQHVSAGEPLVVLEAMKMEHTMKAQTDGVVCDLSVAVDDLVEAGTLLLSVESTDE